MARHVSPFVHAQASGWPGLRAKNWPVVSFLPFCLTSSTSTCILQ
jgi:hypothetical protein